MLYFKYFKNHVKTAGQFKLNSVLTSISSAIVSLGELISIWILFQSFERVGVWGFYESCLMFGIITTCYSISECFGRGFDQFSSLIKFGDLDRLLVRPVGIIYQVFGYKIEFSKLSRIIVGIVISIIAIVNLGVSWTFSKIIVLIGTFACGVCVTLGLIIIAAGICVFTFDNTEFLNILTNGSKELSYYPINIYNKWLSRIFTVIIPLGCFNYLPISYIMGYGSISPLLCGLAPFIGCLFIIPCLIFFKLCLKKYQGSGT